MYNQQIWDSIVNCWQAKTILSALTALLSFMFGDMGLPFLALWGMVFLDLFSRWAAIAKQTLDESGEPGGLVAGFHLARRQGLINAHTMGHKFVPKVLAYIFVLIGVNWLGIIMTAKYSMSGVPFSTIAADAVSTYLALTELISIIKNFEEMGVTGLAPLSSLFTRRREEMLNIRTDSQNTTTQRREGDSNDKFRL